MFYFLTKPQRVNQARYIKRWQKEEENRLNEFLIWCSVLIAKVAWFAEMETQNSRQTHQTNDSFLKHSIEMHFDRL